MANQLSRNIKTEEISATLLARKAGIERTRLSFFECGHIQPTKAELPDISSQALEDAARAALDSSAGRTVPTKKPKVRDEGKSK